LAPLPPAATVEAPEVEMAPESGLAPEAAISPKAAPEQPPPPALALAPHTVIVMVPTTYSDAEMAAEIDMLKAGGFTLGEPKRVPFKIKADHVRYYHAEDKATADALALSIGGEARDFTGADSRPPEGLIEVFLQGGAAPVAKAAPAKKVRNSAPAPAISSEAAEQARIQALRDKIVRRLQQGNNF
jgi:hypothetical protein